MRKALVCFLALSACGPLTPPVMDSGTQVVVDAGVDAGTPDAAIELDAGVDAGGPDAAVELDAGVDAGVDAGIDAGSSVDAGPCDGGFCLPEKITGELIDPWDLVVDSNNLYWLEYGLATNGLEGQLMRQDKRTICLKRDAGCATDLNTQAFGRFRVDSMTLAGEELCWTENYVTGRDVVCQSVITNAERFIARNQPAATEPISSAGELLWVNFGTSAAMQNGQVMRKSLSAPAATMPTVIASMRAAPNSVTVSQGNFVWAEAGTDGGLVMAQPMDGGTAFVMASAQALPLSVVDCSGALYWVNYRGNTVVRNGTPIVSNQKSPFQITCDSTHLYWLNAGVTTNGADGELWQARLDGSEAAPMVRGISLAWALTMDDTYVYYIAQGTVTRVDGVIWRVRKHK